MADRELLELAAKAAGIEGEWCDCEDHADGILLDDMRCLVWNPLTDDGDALRLAVNLRIVVDYYQRQSKDECACAAWAVGSSGGAEHEELGSDPYAATRRAIVRAAAAIGEAMP